MNKLPFLAQVLRSQEQLYLFLISFHCFLPWNTLKALAVSLLAQQRVCIQRGFAAVRVLGVAAPLSPAVRKQDTVLWKCSKDSALLRGSD